MDALTCSFLPDTSEYIYVNKMFEKITGYSKKEVLGKTPFAVLWSDKVDKTLKEQFLRVMQKAAAEEEEEEEEEEVFHSEELVYKRKNGSEYDVELSMYPVREHAKVIFYVLMHRDITERKRHQKELEQANQLIVKEMNNTKKFQQAVDASTDAVIITTAHGTAMYVNHAWEQLTGYTRGEVLGKNPKLLKSGQTPEAVYKNLWSAISAGKTFTTDEIVNRRKDGSLFASELMVYPVLEDGKVAFFVGIQRDITQRKETEEAKSEFISMVAHQLKTPVAEIKGYAENMLGGLTGPLTELQLEFLTDIREISTRNYHLISDLLNISKLDRGVIAVNIEAKSLNDLVQRTVRSYRKMLEEKGLKLDIPKNEVDVTVLVDEEKTMNALGNVIHNAIEATEKGSIRIRSYIENNDAFIEVEDTGPGISAENVEKLFTKDQIFGGFPRAGGGAGLGLYIVKKFMLLQHGDVSVQSTVGKGTIFTFKVPILPVG